ncbi:MAG TPA: hypothetical protein VFW88_00875, partial [Burkholderiales bacterium]|nr:hypothetical protein [Burkholderiales bacterium]
MKLAALVHQIFVEAVIQRFQAHPKGFGGFSLVSPLMTQRREDHFAFDFGERCADPEVQVFTQFQAYRPRAADLHLVIGHDESPLQRILQFAHVSRPRVGAQQAQRRG